MELFNLEAYPLIRERFAAWVGGLVISLIHVRDNETVLQVSWASGNVRGASWAVHGEWLGVQQSEFIFERYFR